MKKIYVFLLIIFASIFFFNSCYKDIEINIEESERRIVMNAMFFNDSTVKVSLTKTVGLNYSYNKILPRVENATVKLYENDVFVENLTYTENGIYVTNILVEKNKRYKIIAEVDDKIVTGEAIIPEDNSFEKIKLIQTNEYQENIVEFTIPDVKDIENFYVIDAYFYDTLYYWNEDYTQIDSLGLYKNYANIHFDDQFSVSEMDYIFFNPYINSGIIFNDHFFDGQKYVQNINVSAFKWSESPNPLQDSFYVYFRLFSVNEDFYNYIISYGEYQYSIDNPFVEPVNVYSNIEGGIGILGGFSFTVDSVKVPFSTYVWEY